MPASQTAFSLSRSNVCLCRASQSGRRPRGKFLWPELQRKLLSQAKKPSGCLKSALSPELQVHLLIVGYPLPPPPPPFPRCSFSSASSPDYKSTLGLLCGAEWGSSVVASAKPICSCNYRAAPLSTIWQKTPVLNCHILICLHRSQRQCSWHFEAQSAVGPANCKCWPGADSLALNC